jgi:hypothetical protein
VAGHRTAHSPRVLPCPALPTCVCRWQLALDGAANDKLAAGLRSFNGDTERLVEILKLHPGWK